MHRGSMMRILAMQKNLQRRDQLCGTTSNRKCSEEDEYEHGHGVVVAEYTAKLCVDN